MKKFHWREKQPTNQPSRDCFHPCNKELTFKERVSFLGKIFWKESPQKTKIFVERFFKKGSKSNGTQNEYVNMFYCRCVNSVYAPIC